MAAKVQNQRSRNSTGFGTRKSVSKNETDKTEPEKEKLPKEKTCLTEPERNRETKGNLIRAKATESVQPIRRPFNGLDEEVGSLKFIKNVIRILAITYELRERQRALH